MEKETKILGIAALIIAGLFYWNKESVAASNKKAIEDKAAAGKAATEKELADQKAAAEKELADQKAAAEKAAADKALADKLAADKAEAERVAAAEKALYDLMHPPFVSISEIHENHVWITIKGGKEYSLKVIEITEDGKKELYNIDNNEYEFFYVGGLNPNTNYIIDVKQYLGDSQSIEVKTKRYLDVSSSNILSDGINDSFTLVIPKSNKDELYHVELNEYIYDGNGYKKELPKAYIDKDNSYIDGDFFKVNLNLKSNTEYDIVTRILENAGLTDEKIVALNTFTWRGMPLLPT